LLHFNFKANQLRIKANIKIIFSFKDNCRYKKNLDLRARFKFSLGGGFGVNGLLYFVVFFAIDQIHVISSST